MIYDKGNMENKSNSRRRRGEYPGIQKLKTDNEKSNRQSIHRDRQDKEKKNGVIGTVIIVVRVSDNRKRDIDGMVSTILDTVVRAGLLDDDSIQQFQTISAKVTKVKSGEEGFDLFYLTREGVKNETNN